MQNYFGAISFDCELSSVNDESIFFSENVDATISENAIDEERIFANSTLNWPIDNKIYSTQQEDIILKNIYCSKNWF